MEHKIKTSRTSPEKVIEPAYSHAAFDNGQTFAEKKNGKLPAMGWNSWNAFGSGNTESLTKAMAEKMVELELDKLGYSYLVLDDGCYCSERKDGRLVNEPVKFPNGFRHLADFIHAKGLKFGMYNDIGTNLCAGAAVGTCGFEDVDAKSYADWDIDFLKVDNCYYLWDNATFSNPENAKYSFAPNVKSITVSGEGYEKTMQAFEGSLLGRGAKISEAGYATNIGTFDGTNVGTTPVGDQSGELSFVINAPKAGAYDLIISYATGKEPGVGQWLQVAVGEKDKEVRVWDDMLPETEGTESFTAFAPIKLSLSEGENLIRIMNHRRQENTLQSYAAMFYGLQEYASKDVILSICEWGKTQPQNWGYKVGDSWRILNDITFSVGWDGNPGNASWSEPGTNSIASQYNKAVVMDEFAGLNRGWNDPDMMVIGMNGIDEDMMQSHMVMWCMMNSPLMLGMDLRRVEKHDTIWNIIANKDYIDLNQDALGIQAKRIFSTLEADAPDKVYITNLDRVDVLAKPLANGDFALSFLNISDVEKEGISVDIDTVIKFIGGKLVNTEAVKNAEGFTVTDLWTKEAKQVGKVFEAPKLKPHGNYTVRVSVK